MHGGWQAWERLPLVMRAKLLAHEFEKNMRDHYMMDQRKEEKPEEEKEPGAFSLGEQIRRKWFGKPESVTRSI